MAATRQVMRERREQELWIVMSTFSVLSPFLLVGLVSRPVGTQDLMKALRAADAKALSAAAQALDSPASEEINSLLRLIRYGWGKGGKRGVAGELAFGVLGWWALEDAEIADLLYKKIQGRAWSDIDGDLFLLAVLGAGDGQAWAKKWIGQDRAGWRRCGWWLLRHVGGAPAMIQAETKLALASKNEADRLEEIYEQASEELTRWTALWAMARSGSFRTRWMLRTRSGLEGMDALSWFDRSFEYLSTKTALRLVGELVHLKPEERSRVLGWVGAHLGEARLRRAVLDAELEQDERVLLLPFFAKYGEDAPELVPFWLRCLDYADEQKSVIRAENLRRLACLGLAKNPEAARPHVAKLEALLALEPAKDSLLLLSPARASAIHALGAIGAKALGADAKRYAARIEPFTSSKNEVVAAAAVWALPRLRGVVPPGTWLPEGSRDGVAFDLGDLSRLREDDSRQLENIPGWPAAARRLAVPRLLAYALEEDASLPPRQMSFAGGLLGPMERITDTRLNGLKLRMLAASDPRSWRELCAVRAAALASAGAELDVAAPLLEWLAPRRPGLGRLLGR